jgi:exodeoxyribonuclease V beta subunit
VVPDRVWPEKISDDDAMARFKEWEAAGGLVIEESVVAPMPALPTEAARVDLAARHFHRQIDATWRRTSYSGLIRAAEATPVSSEPEVVELDDEVAEIPLTTSAVGADVPSPMADLPMGAKFGTLVHAVLETADPFAADLKAELAAQIREHSVWWPVDVPTDEFAASLVPLHDTPLGPLAPGATLRQIGLRDRLREMDFEFPLAGGDVRGDAPRITLADVGRLFDTHMPADDPLASYTERLSSGALASQSLKGYLTGSLDVVLRVGGKYVVADYKTNWLGEPDRPLSAADYGQARMAEAMLHSDYPLQALLYCIVLHRFLRWRQPGYDPEQHLGGVLYLFVRGMCGDATPVVDGHPAGVFSWRPPAALIVALSDLLDAGAVAA